MSKQAGDSEAWKELFDPDAVLLDDGHPRDLERFSDEAVGHERFASIDTVRDGGLNIEGELQSDVSGLCSFGLSIKSGRSRKGCSIAGRLCSHVEHPGGLHLHDPAANGRSR